MKYLHHAKEEGGYGITDYEAVGAGGQGLVS